NLSRAAERLGITQPTLSLAIQRLETALGSEVFLRSRSGVQLTPSGKRLLQQATQLLHAWEKLRQQAQRDENEVRGRYTLGCHPSVGLYALPSFISHFLSQYPELE